MAEVVGTVASAVTLAGLVKLCIEAFDVIAIAKSQDMDLKKLNLRLNIEKCRLWTWGQAMGLTQHQPPDSSKPLDNYPFISVVEECLGFIINLFQSSDTLKSKYGCQKVEHDCDPLCLPGVSTPGPIERLSMSFDDFKVRGLKKMKQTRFAQKGSWVIRDRKKFELLISEVKALIDGLQDITKDVASLAGQDRAIRSRITAIDDVETLDMVAEVCEEDHPRISDAASTKADAISLTTTIKRDISDWAGTVEDSDSDTETVNAIESWTTTEMKHKLFSLLKSRSDRVAAGGNALQRYSTSLGGSREHIIRSSIESNEQILQEIAKSSADRDYQDEVAAIQQWFRVLSDAERAHAFYTLAQDLGEKQITFFCGLFQHKADLIAQRRAKSLADLAEPVIHEAGTNVRDHAFTPVAKTNFEETLAKEFSSFSVNEHKKEQNKKHSQYKQIWKEFADFSNNISTTLPAGRSSTTEITNPSALASVASEYYRAL